MHAGTKEIQQWLLARNPSVKDIDLERDLLRDQLVDSLGFVELVFNVQEAYGVSIDMSELDVETLRTLSRIEAAFAPSVQSCLSSGAP